MLHFLESQIKQMTSNVLINECRGAGGGGQILNNLSFLISDKEILNIQSNITYLLKSLLPSNHCHLITTNHRHLTSARGRPVRDASLQLGDTAGGDSHDRHSLKPIPVKNVAESKCEVFSLVVERSACAACCAGTRRPD